MTASSIYLLTALLIHLAFTVAGLSRTKYYELIYLLCLVHLPAMLLCVITAIISLFGVDVLSKVFLGTSLALTASRLYASWLWTYEYFRTIDSTNQKK